MSADRAGLFLADIAATPDVLEALLDAYAAAGSPLAALPSLAPRRIRLVGLGSSRFAAATAAHRLRAAGLDAQVETASSTWLTPPARDVLLVAISASGSTGEVVDAARRHRGTSLVVAVTNRPEAELAREADVCLPLLAGVEAAGIASRTYAASLVVLGMLAGALVGERPEDRLRAAVVAGRAVHDGRAGWLPAAADVLDGDGEIHVVGDGARLGSLEQAALMLREAPRLSALPVDAGEWLHVAVYTLLPGGRMLLYAGTPYDAELERTVAARGGRLVAVGPAEHRGHPTIPLDFAAPGDLIARAVAEAGVAALLAAELWQRVPGD